jgi:hypothetical protein
MAQQPQRELIAGSADNHVDNKTRAIKVLGFYKLAPGDPNSAYSLVMENSSGKEIIAYSIGYNEHGSIGYGGSICPGEQFERQVPTTEHLIIRYVFFDDGSMDGDREAGAEWTDRVRGELEQLERIKVLLGKAVNSQDIEWLINQIRELPEDTQGHSFHFQLGLRRVKDQALLAVKRFDRSNLSVELGRLNDKTAEELGQLRRFMRQP